MSEAVATQQQELAGKYHPYPEYKDSGVIWSGFIPSHWEPIRFKHVFVEKPKTSNTELPAGSISFGKVVFKDEEKLAEETKASYQEVKVGEFLVNPLNLNFDLKSLRTALSDIDVVVSTGYIVLQCYRQLEARYARWLLHEFDVAHMKSLGAGVRQTIGFNDIGNSYFCMPQLEEQQTIAAFLDYETARIDRLIAKQQQLIELLKEKRQAVISHAVTKGLNPDAPMKDSGIEWLGQVPEHWVVSDLSYTLSAIADIDHYMPESVDIGVPYLMTGDLKNFAHEIDFSECKQVSYVEYGKLSRKIQASIGDVIVARYATIGTATYVDIDKEFLVSYACVTVKPNLHKVAGLYLYYFIKSHSFLEGLLNKVNTNTQGNVGINDLKKVKISLPDVQEQGEVVLYLESITKKIDSLSRQAERAITLMNERRTALISAAVTGKIDLRGWTAPTDEVVA